MNPPALVPMLAKQVEQLPPAKSRAGGWRYEPKWDGYRAILRLDPDRGVHLISRRGRSLKRAFPELVDAGYEQLPADTILDGEIVIWSPQGRLDFGALQTRNLATGPLAAHLATETPAHYLAFDLLRLRGIDYTTHRLDERRTALEELFTQVPGASALALGRHTDNDKIAAEWMTTLAAVGVEGIIAKPARSTYRPGDRTQWVKVKHYASTEAIVGGVTGTLDRPVELMLGRRTRPDGAFRMVGRTVPIRAGDATQLGEHLAPASADHPWPDLLPAGWPPCHRESDYTKVDPTIVVEVRVDVATQADRWRHGLRYLRLRTDLAPEDVPWDLDTT